MHQDLHQEGPQADSAGVRPGRSPDLPRALRAASRAGAPGTAGQTFADHVKARTLRIGGATNELAAHEPGARATSSGRRPLDKRGLRGAGSDCVEGVKVAAGVALAERDRGGARRDRAHRPGGRHPAADPRCVARGVGHLAPAAARTRSSRTRSACKLTPSPGIIGGGACHGQRSRATAPEQASVSPRREATKPRDEGPRCRRGRARSVGVGWVGVVVSRTGVEELRSRGKGCGACGIRAGIHRLAASFPGSSATSGETTRTVGSSGPPANLRMKATKCWMPERERRLLFGARRAARSRDRWSVSPNAAGLLADARGSAGFVRTPSEDRRAHLCSRPAPPRARRNAAISQGSTGPAPERYQSRLDDLCKGPDGRPTPRAACGSGLDPGLAATGPLCGHAC